MKRLMAVTAGLLLSGCGGASTGGPGPATLEVEQRFAGDTLYIEGSLSYIRLEGPTRVEEQLSEGRGQLQLEPGSYALSSWQRPCDGNCGYLDAPTDRCSATFEAGAGAALHASIVVRPGEGCSIEIR